MKILNISLFAVFVIKTVFELALFSLYAEVREDLGKKNATVSDGISLYKFNN